MGSPERWYELIRPGEPSGSPLKDIVALLALIVIWRLTGGGC